MIRETTAKSILAKHKKVDSWFLSGYSMNLYRGCQHDCIYCDGRAEKYRVEGTFGQDVLVKMNAPELLEKALNPMKKRKPMKRAFVLVGGGVGDFYQKIEKKYQMVPKVLHILEKYSYPIHLLTKSILIERDLPILLRMNQTQRVLVSMSFSSMDDGISARVEPGCDLPSRRLSILARFKQAGLATGVLLMPVIPGLTDSEQQLSLAMEKARDVDADFILFGCMTLKQGVQQDHFMTALKTNYPSLELLYRKIYQGNRWGNPTPAYAGLIQRQFNQLAKKYQLPRRIPPKIYSSFLSTNDRVMIMLEHIDYILKSDGRDSSYGYAAYSIAQMETPIEMQRGHLSQLRGVGPVTAKIIHEIIENGSSRYLESLL